MPGLVQAKEVHCKGQNEGVKHVADFIIYSKYPLPLSTGSFSGACLWWKGVLPAAGTPSMDT